VDLTTRQIRAVLFPLMLCNDHETIQIESVFRLSTVLTAIVYVSTERYSHQLVACDALY